MNKQWAVALVVLLIGAVVWFAVFNNSSKKDVPRGRELTAKNIGASGPAVDVAGLKETPIPYYSYEDTSKLTKPTPSFGINSERDNQKILFLVFDNMAPVQDLTFLARMPPFTNVERAASLPDTKFDENYQLLSGGDFHWFVGKYTKQNPEPGEEPIETVLVGAYPAAEKGKSIVVVGNRLNKDSPYDYKSTLWLCDQMDSNFTARNRH